MQIKPIFNEKRRMIAYKKSVRKVLQNVKRAKSNVLLIVPFLQRTKKVVSDSLGQVDFAIGQVNSVFNWPTCKWCLLRNSNNRRTVKSKGFRGLVEMTSRLVNASFSLPKWQAVKMIFFAPCVFISVMVAFTGLCLHYTRYLLVPHDNYSG